MRGNKKKKGSAANGRNPVLEQHFLFLYLGINVSEYWGQLVQVVKNSV